MFEKLKLKGAFYEWSRRLKISVETQAVLLPPNLDLYVKEMKARKLDPVQALVLMLSTIIARAAENGALEKIRAAHPQIYADMKTVWVFCGGMVHEDYERFAKMWVVPTNHHGSPFDLVEGRQPTKGGS